MKRIYYSVTFASLICLFSASCTKNDQSAENANKATLFEAFITDKGFRPTSFYSDKPIDYNQDDSMVKAETNLWPYVKLHIRDDRNQFMKGTGLRIEQNETKLPSNDSAFLIRNYSVGSDASGVYLNFVDYDYIPLRYKLLEFTDDHFVIYVDWRDKKKENAAMLFSRFDLLP